VEKELLIKRSPVRKKSRFEGGTWVRKKLRRKENPFAKLERKKKKTTVCRSEEVQYFMLAKGTPTFRNEGTDTARVSASGENGGNPSRERNRCTGFEVVIM